MPRKSDLEFDNLHQVALDQALESKSIHKDALTCAGNPRSASAWRETMTRASDKANDSHITHLRMMNGPFRELLSLAVAEGVAKGLEKAKLVRKARLFDWVLKGIIGLIGTGLGVIVTILIKSTLGA